MFVDHAGSLPAFQWYSIAEGDPRRGGRAHVIRKPRNLRAFFARRHRHGETLRLRVADLGGSWLRDGVAIGFTLVRHADDLLPAAGGPARVGYGGAELNCRTRRFYVFAAAMPSMKGLPTAADIGPCPRPRGWRLQSGPAIACTRAKS